MASNFSDRDLSIVPNLTFSFLDEYIKSCISSSGEKPINKGFKYFSEGYIQDLKVEKLTNGCKLTGTCYKSQRKNDAPHQIKISFDGELTTPHICKAECSCPIGLSEGCGHISGVLYQLAQYKMHGLKAMPEDIAKTSQPQTWHTPRGEQIRGKVVQDLQVSGYQRSDITRETTPRTIKSTLSNPVRGPAIDLNNASQILATTAPDMLIIPDMQDKDMPLVNTKFGTFKKGSVLSYQQQLETDCIINIYDGIGYPNLPVENFMNNNYIFVLNESKTVKFDGVKLEMTEIKRFEEQTRLQSLSPMWFKVRRHRLTSSHMGSIAKRRKDFEALATRLHSTRRATTAAMRRGLACEPEAARAYAAKCQNRVNLYPCGVVVNFWAPWIAASPDRKVYYPDRNPPIGLLEIKCPTVTRMENKCLKQDQHGNYKLKKTHDYFYQVMTQLAVTGLQWCDFYMWWDNENHLETIYFDEDTWETIKTKADEFYFSHFI